MANGGITQSSATGFLGGFGGAGTLIGAGAGAGLAFNRSRRSRRQRRRFRGALTEARQEATRTAEIAAGPESILGQQNQFLREAFEGQSPFINAFQSEIRAQQASRGLFGAGQLAGQQEALGTAAFGSQFRGQLLPGLLQGAFAPELLRQQSEVAGSRRAVAGLDQNPQIGRGITAQLGGDLFNPGLAIGESAGQFQDLENIQNLRRSIAENQAIAQRTGGVIGQDIADVGEDPGSIDQLADVQGILGQQFREAFRQRAAVSGEQQTFLRQRALNQSLQVSPQALASTQLAEGTSLTEDDIRLRRQGFGAQRLRNAAGLGNRSLLSGGGLLASESRRRGLV